MIKVFLGLILIVHIFIFTKLIYFPYPELFVYPYLTNMGLKPYSQILDQHFPGLLFLPINFDNLGMQTPEIARIWSIAIVLLTHIFLFFISREIFKSEKKALIVNLLYLLWQPFLEGWVLWLDSFMPLFLLPAFYFLIKNKLFLTGIFLGLSIVFKQVTIPLAGFVLIYILWKEKKLNGAYKYLQGLFIPVVLMLIYLTSIGVYQDFFYWTIVFNLTTYAALGTSAPPTIGFVTRILFIFGISILALFSKNRQVIIPLFIFIFGSSLSAFDRADFIHFQPALPFILMGTILGFSSIPKRQIFWVAIIIYSAITLWWQNVFYKGHLGTEGNLLSFGDKVFFFDEQTYAIANKIMDYTNPQDKIFIYGAVPHLYQMSKTLPAGDVFVFQFPWFLKEAGNKVLEGIKNDKPEIIVSDRSVKIEDQPIIEFGREIDQYIMENYEIIDQIGTTNFLRRKSP